MSVSVKINGTTYSGIECVRLPLSDGSGYAEFNFAETSVEDVTTTYSITKNLTNVNASNSATSVTEGASYSTILTAVSTYEISNVIVRMGGVDVTSSAYSNGVVSIASVTGNVVITATAIPASSGGTTSGVVNLFDKDTMVTSDAFVNTAGAITSSAGAKYAEIPITGGKSYAMQRQTLSFANGSAGNITLLDASKNVVYKFVPNVSNKTDDGYYSYCIEDDTVHLTLDSSPSGLTYKTDTNRKGVTFTTDSTCAYLRLTIAYGGSDSTETFMVEEGDTCHDYVAYSA